MLRKIRNEKGFTLIELMVVIVIIGILAAVAIPRFMGAQDRAKVGAAENDINSVRQALGLYEIDNSSFDITATTYGALTTAIEGYMSLPDTTNFSFTSYTGTDTTYTLVVDAKNSTTTTLTCTPEGITKAE